MYVLLSKNGDVSDVKMSVGDQNIIKLCFQIVLKQIMCNLSTLHTACTRYMHQYSVDTKARVHMITL